MNDRGVSGHGVQLWRRSLQMPSKLDHYQRPAEKKGAGLSAGSRPHCWSVRSSIELDRLLGLLAARGLFGLVLVHAVALFHHGAGEVLADLHDDGADGLAGRGLLLLGEIAAEAAAIEADIEAAAAGARFDRAGELDFTGGRVDHAKVDGHVGLFLLAADADAAERQ